LIYRKALRNRRGIEKLSLGGVYLCMKRDMLDESFFARDPQSVARDLLGKVIRFRNLSARIIETEAYYLKDKASHASLGFTEKRKALFMDPGTIYMYYARGGDSLNISCKGEGNAVLIKSACILEDDPNIKIMQNNNPLGEKPRKIERLCSGQTLLCKAMGIKVGDWDQKKFDYKKFYFKDIGLIPEKIVKCKRLGIPKGRDEHLLYRYIDFAKAKYCTKNILTARGAKEGVDYFIYER